METKECINCKQIKPITSFKHNPDGTIRRHACTSCLGKRERTKLLLDFFNALGWKCNCCGETDPRFLTLDHVLDDGNKHRETKNEQQILYEARRERYPKNKYQVLCFNCNSGKSINKGICPHKCISAEEYKRKMYSTQFKLGREHVNHNTSNVEARVAGRKEQALNDRIKKAKDGLALLGIYKTEEEIKNLLCQV